MAYAICQGCGKELEKREVEKRTDGSFFHVVPCWSERYEEFEPELCGPVVLMKRKFEDKIIEVCAACKRACCWYGEFMCDDSQNAGVERHTVAELRKNRAGEHEGYWSDLKMEEVYGESAPFGYADTVGEAERHAALEQSHIILLKQLEALQIGMAEAESCLFWAEELKKITDEAGEV